MVIQLGGKSLSEHDTWNGTILCNTVEQGRSETGIQQRGEILANGMKYINRTVKWGKMYRCLKQTFFQQECIKMTGTSTSSNPWFQQEAWYVKKYGHNAPTTSHYDLLISHKSHNALQISEVTKSQDAHCCNTKIWAFWAEESRNQSRKSNYVSTEGGSEQQDATFDW